MTLVFLAWGFRDSAKHDSLGVSRIAGGSVMKPRERREKGEQDLFRSRLDQIINMDQELVKLAKASATWQSPA
jgi:IS5 family transposase